MLTVYDSQGKSYILTEPIGSGGEGTVYSLPDDPEQVAKIYYEAVSEEKSEKLRWMAKHKNEQVLKVAAWITDTLHEAPNGKIVGFLMPNVRAKEIHELYSLKSRRIYFPRATWQFLIHAAANVARAFYVLHKNAHIMGDVNHGNCVVLADGTVKLIDCDSYSVRINGSRFPCEVGVATHLAPELQGKSLSSIERQPAHDNFGLAVIIFQLLFLGRHPFAGNYEGGEDKTLEDSIREMHFAYARDAHLWKIRRPPGTLSLDVVSPRVAFMFERAFLTEQRPEPREWIEALEDLSKSLKPCSLHPGHHFFQDLPACPFCELETKTGLMLFPFVGINQEENFNIFTVENLIASFGTPQQLPAVPEKSPVLPPPSPVLENEQLNYRLRLMMFAVAQIVIVIFLLLSFGNFAAFYVGIWIMVAFIKVHNQSHKALKEGLEFDLESAKQELAEIENEWTRGGTAQFEKNLTQVRQKISEYKQIQQNGQRKLQSLQDEVRRYQLNRYLSTFKIPNAGQKDLEILKISGIRSAADLDKNHLREIEAIDEATKTELLGWREKLESSFQFKPEEIPEAEQKRFTTEFVEKRRNIERDIEMLLGNLRSGSLVVRRNQHHLRSKFDNELRRFQQAESDLKALGSGAAATVTLITVTLSTIFIGNMVQSSIPQRPTYQNGGYRPSEPPRALTYSGAARVSDDTDIVNEADIRENIPDKEIARMPDHERKATATSLYRQSLKFLGSDLEYGKAERKLRLAARLNDKDEVILNQLGDVLYEQKKYKESLNFLNKALKMDAKNAETKTLIGKNHLALYEFEKAREILTQATIQSPDSFLAFFYLGQAQKGLYNYSAAIESFKHVTRVSPNYTDAYYEMALCFEALENAQGVREQYKILLGKDKALAERIKEEIGIQ